MAHDQEGDDEEVGRHKDEHETLPAPEAARDGDGDEAERGQRHGDVLAHAEVAEGEVHADELGDDGEEVEHEEVANREESPKPPETLADQPGVAHARHRTEADDHLLVHDEDRDEEDQRPKQTRPVVLARLGVGGDPACVVVAHHDDDPRTDDRGQGQQAGAPGAP